MSGTSFASRRTNANGNVERVYLTDENDNPLLVVGTTVPTSGTYAKGCIFIDSDVTAGTKALYENQGSTSAVSFNLIGSITQAELADDSVAQDELDYVLETVQINNGSTSGTAEVNSGGQILGWYPTTNTRSANVVSTLAISGTTLTVSTHEATTATMNVAVVVLDASA